MERLLDDFSFSNATGDLNFIIKNGQINELDKRTQALVKFWDYLVYLQYLKDYL